MSKLKSYTPPEWAECFIMLMHYYSTKTEYMQMAALGDIEKIVNICHTHKLNFWGGYLKNMHYC